MSNWTLSEDSFVKNDVSSLILSLPFILIFLNAEASDQNPITWVKFYL